MSVEQALISILVKVGLALTLAGTLLRGRHADCRTFPVYLSLVLACDTMVSLWPARFYTGWFWILQQTSWDIAKLAVALEILYRAVRPFPGAQRPAVGFATALLLLTSAVILFVPGRAGDPYVASAIDYNPRVLTATIWLMTGTALLIVWYRLPVAAFPTAILMGFVPYLVAFTSLLNVLREHGFRPLPYVSLLDASCYLAVTVWWAAHAWAPASSNGRWALESASAPVAQAA